MLGGQIWTPVLLCPGRPASLWPPSATGSGTAPFPVWTKRLRCVLRSLGIRNCLCLYNIAARHLMMPWKDDGKKATVQCRRSVTFWCGSVPPDPAPFFSDFKDTKKYFLPYFLLKSYFASIISCRPLNTFLRKGKDPDPFPYLWLMDPDPGGQNMRVRVPNTATDDRCPLFIIFPSM
jgi:hypothetical protein